MAGKLVDEQQKSSKSKRSQGQSRQERIEERRNQKRLNGEGHGRGMGASGRARAHFNLRQGQPVRGQDRPKWWDGVTWLQRIPAGLSCVQTPVSPR